MQKLVFKNQNYMDTIFRLHYFHGFCVKNQLFRRSDSIGVGMSYRGAPCIRLDDEKIWIENKWKMFTIHTLPEFKMSEGAKMVHWTSCIYYIYFSALLGYFWWRSSKKFGWKVPKIYYFSKNFHSILLNFGQSKSDRSCWTFDIHSGSDNVFCISAQNSIAASYLGVWDSNIPCCYYT